MNYESDNGVAYNNLLAAIEALSNHYDIRSTVTDTWAAIEQDRLFNELQKAKDAATAEHNRFIQWLDTNTLLHKG